MKKIMLLVMGSSFFLMNFLVGQEASAPLSRDQGMWQTVVMISIAMLFFYFILWRPEQKRRKVIEDQRTSMKKGDRVIAMGILGTVLQVEEHTVVLKMYDGAKIEVLKGAITEVSPAEISEPLKEKE